MKNPYKAVEAVMTIIGWTVLTVLALGAAIVVISGFWASGWGAWALTVPLLFAAICILAKAGIALAEEGAEAIGRKWRNSSRNWERNHTSSGDRAEIKEEI